MNANEAILVWADEYSRMADVYEGRVVPRFESVARIVLDLAAPTPGETFLDVGTGTGLLARLLASKVAPQVVVAIDLADNAISVGSYRAGDAGIRNIRFEMMDSRNIVYRSRLFDGVASNLGIPTLGYDRTFAEVHRVLKPEGRFVFSEWDAQSQDAWGAVLDLLVKHGTLTPSKELALVREARRATIGDEEAMGLRKPAAVMRALKAAGFSRMNVTTKALVTAFAGVEDLVAFVASWGWPDRELAEMPPDRREAFDADLLDRLAGRVGPEGLVETWPLHFYVARP